MNQIPVYQGEYPVYNVSEMLAGEVLSLPIWAELDESTVEFVADQLKSCLNVSREMI